MRVAVGGRGEASEQRSESAAKPQQRQRAAAFHATPPRSLLHSSRVRGECSKRSIQSRALALLGVNWRAIRVCHCFEAMPRQQPRTLSQPAWHVFFVAALLCASIALLNSPISHAEVATPPSQASGDLATADSHAASVAAASSADAASSPAHAVPVASASTGDSLFSDHDRAVLAELGQRPVLPPSLASLASAAAGDSNSGGVAAASSSLQPDSAPMPVPPPPPPPLSLLEPSPVYLPDNDDEIVDRAFFRSDGDNAPQHDASQHAELPREAEKKAQAETELSQALDDKLKQSAAAQASQSGASDAASSSLAAADQLSSNAVSSTKADPSAASKDSAATSAPSPLLVASHDAPFDVYALASRWWARFNQLDDVVQSAVEAFARSWKPSSSSSPPSSSSSSASSSRAKSKSSASTRARVASLTVYTQEIQVYLCLVGLLCILLLSIAIALAWHKYRAAIRMLDEYVPPQVAQQQSK